MRPLLLAPLLAVLLTHSSYGLGIRVADQSAAGTARSNAFAATADDPSAVYYNPAGITQLDGLNVLSGTYGIIFGTRARVDVSPNTPYDTKYNPQALPQYYITWKPKHDFPVAFGLGVYSPFGFDLKYPVNVPFRNIGEAGNIEFFSITPVIAWQVTPTLSIAAGPTINYGSAKLIRGVIKPADEFRFTGDDIAEGFEAGIHWQPSPMHSFGLTYHSAVGMDFQGHSHVQYQDVVVPIQVAPGVVVPFRAVKGVNHTETADASFHFPQFAVFGYSFRPTPDWNFEADIDWTDWDSLNTVVLKQKSGNIALPFNWRSSFMYEFGVTRTFGTWHVSAGYMYSENSVPNESFSPLVPDSDRHVFGVGVGRKLEHWKWDLAYQFAYGPTRVISQGTVADGQYTFKSNALTFSIGYTF